MIFALGQIYKSFVSPRRRDRSSVIVPSKSKFSATISAFHCTRPFIVTFPPANPRSRPIVTPLLILIVPPAIFTSPEALCSRVTFPPAALMSPKTTPLISTSQPAMMRSSQTVQFISIFPPATIALSRVFPLTTISHPASTKSPATFPVISTFPAAT